MSANLCGFKGDDSIDGGAGDDTLHGHRGNDRLVGGPGDDYLDGGFGNDVLVGGTGNDSYELRRSMGQDYIYDEDATPGNVDTIHATTALCPEDIEVMRDGDDLLLRIRLTTSGVRVGNWFGASRFCVEQVRFDDGTVWDVAAIKARLGDDPAGSGDLAFGQGWGTTIARRHNSIFSYGSPATDTLIMKRGGPIDMLSPAPLWTQYVDMIKIDAGIAPTDLKLMRDHDDLILLAVGSETGFLRVRHGFDRARIEFADGTVWDSAVIREGLRPQLRNGRFAQRSFVEQALNAGVFYGYDDSHDVIDGSRDGDWIYGFGGDDILNGHDGRDRMDGGEGNDRMAGGGQADIMYGGAGSDFLDGGRGPDYLDGGAGDDTLVGGTGDDIIDGGGGDDRINGGGGNDVLHGGRGRDLMRGGVGNDLLYGGADGDTYYLEPGMGQDIVVETEGAQRGGNVVDVAARWRPADIVLARNGPDLQVGSADLQDRLNLKSLFDGGKPYIDAIIFSDGQRWSFSELERRSIACAATAGDDVLHGRGGAQWWEGDPLCADIHDVLDGLDGADQLWGHAGNDILAGGGGDDLIMGGAGSDLLAGGTGCDRLVRGRRSDVIVFNRGDGNDTIAFQDPVTDSAAAPGRGPTLSLGGVRCDELALRKSGSDLVLELQSGDSVSFEGWYTSPAEMHGTLLQLVTDSTGDYLAGSGDILRRRKIAQFDFNSMVAQYDRALEALPGLDAWSVTAALTHHHLSGNDTMAIGGELSYHYAHHGQWRQLGADVMSAGLVNPLFGNSDQAIARPAGAILSAAC